MKNNIILKEVHEANKRLAKIKLENLCDEYGIAFRDVVADFYPWMIGRDHIEIESEFRKYIHTKNLKFNF